MENIDFIKGALIGGCLGGLFVLFVAPKAGNELREDIAEGVNNFSQQTQEFTDDVKEYAQKFLDSLQGKPQKHCPNKLLIGAVAGIILGALAGLLLAPQSGPKLRERLGEEYDEIREKAEDVMKGIHKGKKDFEDKIGDWKDTFTSIVDKLSHSKKKNFSGSSFNDIADWATIGLRCYNMLQSGR